ncbi:hypothetical protein [Halomonas koreensis]|uniref:Uncharacterized protein n=1 Tax=Halomonas koreensis TaxID=245385 RepID=A0ABU1G4V6_9GAMM|nr:hypothetical protein [Halomonas koreensis]MDR5867967.1 hypothetical protein [Halomonas koreensis]
MPIDYRRALSPAAQRHYDAVMDGDNDAQLAFAEHLIEEGLLGCGIEELRLGLTVGHLVERYAATKDGTAELKAWSIAVADEHDAAMAA